MEDLVIYPVGHKEKSRAAKKDRPELSGYLFWDCDIDVLDFDADKMFVMERVFTRGRESDEREVFRYYGADSVKATVVKIKYLDGKTLSYLSVILELPKRRFKCYRKSLSKKPFGMF
jgi:hypothetical protein